MSDSEEDGASAGKQKSIFSGMGRVKQINHLREKWSPKPKSPLPDRGFVDAPPASPWSRWASPDKQLFEPSADSVRRTPRRALTTISSPRRPPVVSVLDMERFLAITSWLENNGINVAQVNTETRENPKDVGLFDDMFSSLDVLESSLKSELSSLDCSYHNTRDTSCREAEGWPSGSQDSALFDYLTVIGADMLDVKIRHFWRQRENVFEATVAFADPPASQFNAESLEHFCFPSGIKGTSVADERAVAKEGEFFVLLISGGGLQGQSVQYAMCMQGTVTVRGGDGKHLLLPVCYCIIAQTPLIPFFRGVLQGLLDNLRDEFEARAEGGCGPLSSIVTDQHASFIDDILQRLRAVPLPDKGLSVSVDVFPAPRPELALARPQKENDADEKVALLLQWALPSLLSRLSIDRLLEIVSLLLLEMKLVVVSDEIPLLSSATLGLASLLHPLAWAGPLISVLPLSMHEYMEAPVPLICGVEELPQDFEVCKGTCVLHLMENRVQLHCEDEQALSKLQMPELDSLSCDLTRFTRQMLGRVAGSFRDNVMPLSTHLVIHRVHRHIECLINACARPDAGQEVDARETRFVAVFVQTQMYQKYQDDQPVAAGAEATNQQVYVVQAAADQEPVQTSSSHTQHDALKAATGVLFQIALAGVGTLPHSRSRTNSSTESVASAEDVNPKCLDVVELPVLDEPEPGSMKLSSTAATPSARSCSSLKNSPKEHELLSPALSEASTHTDRRPDRTFVWPLSQSELDVFWGNDEAGVGSAQLKAPMGETFDSPRRSPNNESDASYADGMKSVARSDHGGVVNAQRGDTETTISIFDTALNEALGSADAAEDSWWLESVDDQRQSSQHDDDSDDDRSTNHESSAEDANASHHKEEPSKETGLEQTIACSSTRKAWPKDADELQNDERAANHTPQDVALPREQRKALLAGISVDSRGAWEGWCEGKLFVSADLSTLTWERRAVAFAALNMSIADITSVALEDRQPSSSGPHRRRVRLRFNSEAIYFQASSSPHQDEFFSALRELIQPPPGSATERQDSFPSWSSPSAAGPHLPFPVRREEERRASSDDHDSVQTDGYATTPTLPVQKETDLDQFKRKLQRGFLVEKHGRLGRPHAKIVFTDALCSHISWRKPPAAGPDDQQTLANMDFRSSSLFSHSKSIPVDSITALVTGKQTTVFRRAAASKSSERACLSILTPTRTLDICAQSLQGFQELYRGFSLLVEEVKRTRDGLD